MLVLSRKVQETIVLQIGNERVVIAVCDIDKNKVRVGVEASREVVIWRGELETSSQGRPVAGVNGRTPKPVDLDPARSN